jgi:UDP-N-acetylglucosamine 1-carboxyvinyltransferase
MKKYIISGARELKGSIDILGSKNSALKAIVAACLTQDWVELSNIPLISDVFVMLEILKLIGGEYKISDHTLKIRLGEIKELKLPLEMAAKIRTSSMFLAPLLFWRGEAAIPNPGGCRIGARPINWHIQALEKLGAEIKYNSHDGYFYARAKKLKGTIFEFPRNSRTGTETFLLAASIAEGRTVIKNAAQEPTVDDLILLLNKMGAKIRRVEPRTIVVDGVKELHGTSFSIMPDSDEAVTFAILSALTGGKVSLSNINEEHLKPFFAAFERVGGEYEEASELLGEKKKNSFRFFVRSKIKPVDITTGPFPGFATDWQGPWCVFMTQAEGVSIIHETVFEDRFGYVEDLVKMGAKIELFNPPVHNPQEFYNFDWRKSDNSLRHAIRIFGKTPLHNAVIRALDLRAGATLVIAALIAKGESILLDAEHIERGYENFVERLISLGAKISVKEEV